MKRVLILSALAVLSLSALAQNVADGFYRVQNSGSKRYAYVYDNTGAINVQTTSADMGAIVLYATPEKRFTDPASVIYIKNKGKNGNYNLYDLESQGTGVYKIINYYVSVYALPIPNTYWVFEPTYSMYLWDATSSTFYDKSHITTTTTSQNKKPELRNWSVFPVDSSTDEYLGVAPDAAMKVGAKYYKPYYLGFAMDFASSGMKGYYISDIKSDAVIIKEVVGTIPAATPIILECSSPNATNNRVTLKYQTVAALTDNKLAGNYFCYENHGPTAYKEYDATTMRLLSVKNGRLCYITDTAHKHTTLLEFSDGNTSTTMHCVPANSSYLQVPAGAAAELPVMTQAEYDALHPSAKRGDVNGDGSVNATDAALLYRHIAAGKKSTEVPAADINGDGSVNATDAALLYRIIAAGQ